MVNEPELHPAHRMDVENYKNAQQKILDELQEDRRSTPTGMVYHYCGHDGMKGITNTGTLWLSDYTSMFDKTEIKYGVDIGMEILRRTYEDCPKTGRLRRFVEGTERGARRGWGTIFPSYILSRKP